MKKLILVALILITKVSATNAQQLNNAMIERDGLLVKNEVRPGPVSGSANDQAYYLKKSRNNRIASFSLMGGGAVLLGIGALTFPKDYDIIFENSNSKENQADLSTVLMTVGVAAMLSSIPFTVMAGVNKRKANVIIDSQKTGLGMPGVSNTITSLTMRIPIGK